ncbi:MAG TPA: phosphonate C-P lyase system protein PhnH [Anaerolineae bacterium]|jgi:alpha-D-ribose 1-methylphosphonate 5-triphosphate synthase subunit PhnH|nr:phosphonate C-P lyase system protein PhnH [Anaerolineae bacterium]
MILPVKEAFDPVFDAQQVFRLLLDCMARPGKINYLPDIKIFVGKGTSFLYLIARTLLDTEVSFAFIDTAKTGLDKEIMRCTGSRLVDVERADFILCDGRIRQSDLYLANIGTLEFPDRAATVVMKVSQLLEQRPQVPWELFKVDLTGPGIDGSKSIWLDGIHKDNLDWLSLQNQNYPLGVDTVLVDIEGRVACMPRRSELKWEVDTRQQG